MPNDWFNFKQFGIRQGRTAMKVCTDSCVFGAWVPPHNATQILDIGTGTGLLALLLATRTNAPIHAIEIDQNAYLDAADNFENSVYKAQIKGINNSLQEFAQQTGNKYDLIICNPPFFSNNLKSASQSANLALHQEGLTLSELLAAVVKLLSLGGSFYILLPPYEAGVFRNIGLEVGLFECKRLELHKKTGGPIFRHLSQYQFTKTTNPNITQLAIHEPDGKVYTPSFIELMKPYYLNL